ncbi:MAG: hypothetical protein NC203_04740 [Firmicutes bacterium]|nr:hypothetical protein [[Eubacterium] siraeum]MCM1487656.1 hypothetical protein [Bacillota bacterium]
MKEKDIKKLFNAAAYGSENLVGSEEIKSAVMEKLGKNASIGLTSDGDETVQPVFVTVPEKNGKRRIKIAAGATAACLGITVLSLALIRGSSTVGALSQEASPTAEETAAAEEIEVLPQEASPTAEETAAAEEIEVLPQETSQAAEEAKTDIAEFVPEYELRLLDGSFVKGYTDGESPVVEFKSASASHLLSEENGRLYFVKNAGEIDFNDPSKAVKEDITDKISSDNFYLFTYDNPDNPISQTHYVIVGGDVSANCYGYAEVFKAGIKNTWGMTGKYSEEAPERPPLVYDSGTSGKPQWLINGIRALANEQNLTEIMVNGAGSINEYCDFKNVWSNEAKKRENIPTVYCTPNHDNYDFTPIVYPNIEFSLLDGTMIQYSDKEGLTAIQSIDLQYLISYKDGRLYYTGNGNYRDVTDIIGSEEYFQDYYINSVTGLKHYVFVGGDLEKGDFGYYDFFNLSEDVNKWVFVSVTNFDSDKYDGEPFYDENGEIIFTYNWANNAWTEICRKFADSDRSSELEGGFGFKAEFSKLD